MFKQKINQLMTQCFGMVILIISLLFIIFFLTRVALLIKSGPEIEFTVINITGIFFFGLLYDFVTACYFIIPIILYLWLIPKRIFCKNWHLFILYISFFFFAFLLLFNAVSEWFFWDEFNTRFNFIAVDYLIYSTEVIGNIRQSYPIEWIMLAISTLAIGIVYVFRPWIKKTSLQPLSFKRRTFFIMSFLVLPLIFFFTINNKLHYFNKNALVNELSGNGIYELFAAYRNNELDYDQFYKKIETEEVFNQLQKLLTTPESKFTNQDNFNIERQISNSGKEKRLNVILISVESLSADFLGVFGNTKNITPNLDSLAHQALLFTNLYSTGTRTVRGLEALSLCVPPTPGQSIYSKETK